MRKCLTGQKLIIRVRFIHISVSCNKLSKNNNIALKKLHLDLERDGFDEQPLFFCNVATSNEKVVGYTIFYYVYSTWRGKTMYLEDIYVTSEFRGKHVGIKLLKAVAKVCIT